MTDAETVLASSALFLIEDLNRSAEFQAVGISSQLSNSPPLVVTCKPAHNVDLGIDGLYYMIPKVVCDRPVYRMPGTRLAAPLVLCKCVECGSVWSLKCAELE